MAGGTFSSGRAMAAAFKRDMQNLVGRLDRAAERAAELAAAEIAANAPKATGFLASSIHAVGYRIVCDAPYALAVERGSRPHWPPIEPIIAWVTLKGFTGISAAGKPETAESIAWAIAHKISVEGTEPTWFMKSSIPLTMSFLGGEIRAALRGV